MAKVTIYDLARELNISAATVSRALQDNPRISDKTKKAVVALANSRNYRPDTVASHLRTGKGSVIGVVVPRIDRNFFASVIGGIERVANEAGYSVVVSQSNERIADEKSILDMLESKKIDGVAVSLANETVEYSHFKSLIERGTPVVFFDRIPNKFDINASTVQIDNFKAAYDAVSHLIAQGYRKIAHLAGPQTSYIYKQRHDGYCAALEAASIKVNSDLIYNNCITLDTGIEEAKKMVRSSIMPDSVFSAGDYSAIGMIKTLKSLGFNIPSDIAVVGFANEPFDCFVSPSLSSIDQHTTDMGMKTAQLLIKEIGVPIEDRVYVNEILDHNLIIRESSIRQS